MEIIGRLIMMFVLMGIASAVGVGCAGFVLLLFRMCRRPWRRAALFAFLFPPAAMGYVLACLVLSSALSTFLGTPDFIFGDIHEKLPNGYTVDALDKMPECGVIENPDNPSIQVAWVGSLQVEGPYVFGKYDYTCFSRTPEEAIRNYFSFDTRTGRTVNFASQVQLENATAVHVHLTPTAEFRGTQTLRQRITWLLFLLIALAPPFATGLWLVLRLVLLLRPPRQQENLE